MSSSDSWGSYKTPCFQKVIVEGKTTLLETAKCGGEVEYWYFGSDCRYNPPSSGIACKKCGHSYTDKEWGKRK